MPRTATIAGLTLYDSLILPVIDTSADVFYRNDTGVSRSCRVVVVQLQIEASDAITRLM